MILIGQYDSPFVRRVGIALTLYALPFEHRPWSVFSDAEKIRPFNPLTRVPVLVLDDGMALIESHGILDHLDSLVAPEMALFPKAGAARRQALRLAALACGIGDKAVSLFYEKQLHREASEIWVTRCTGQITAALAVLEAEVAARAGGFLAGDRIGHADIALTCIWRHLNEAHPGLIDPATVPALAGHAAAMEAMPVFKAIAQPFIPPA